MKKTQQLFGLLLLILCLCCVACSDESENENNKVFGSWRMLSLQAEVNVDNISTKSTDINASQKLKTSIESNEHLRNFSSFAPVFNLNDGEFTMMLEFNDGEVKRTALEAQYKYDDNILSLQHVQLNPEFEEYISTYYPWLIDKSGEKIFLLQVSGNTMHLTFDATDLYNQPFMMKETGLNQISQQVSRAEIKATYTRWIE